MVIDNIVDDPDYKPEAVNAGTTHPMYLFLTDFLEFADRFGPMSDFVASKSIELIGKAFANYYGIKYQDPNLFPSETGIQNMRKRVREDCLEGHREKNKKLLCIKVGILSEFQKRFSLNLYTNYR